MIHTTPEYDFHNVRLNPSLNSMRSRIDPILERTITFKHSRREWTGIPIMVSNMDTTGTIEMARQAQKYKIITCLHKFYKYTDIPSDLDPDYYATSCGIREQDIKNLDSIMSSDIPNKSNFICIDVANGYTEHFLENVKKIREKYPDKTLIAGNVISGDLVQLLVWSCKVDIVKCGIGNGSSCTTLLKTGIGRPQFTTNLECSQVAHGYQAHIISDGGVKEVGDFCKAFASGADFVMAGGFFAGHDESGGDMVEKDGKKYKQFYGMSSSMAMKKHYGEVAEYRTDEGVLRLVEYKGPVENTIKDILGGLRSLMTYLGATKIKYIKKCSNIRVVY